jgi:hypothetical protein
VSHNLTQGSTSAGDLEGLLQELEGKSLELSFGDQVVLVGHEGRLSNLLTELTGQRDRPFEHGGLACVRAGSVAALRKGKARVDFRFPVVDHGEKDLQAKAQSKMGVASFLAGFVFAALIEVLLNHPDTDLHRAAAVMLTLALALFVAAIYIYDQLSMPPGFWTDGPRPRLPRTLANWRERRIEERWLKTAAQTTPEQADDESAAVRLDGPLFVTMVRASRWLFTPAVALSLLAFVAIVLEVHVWWVTAGAAISVAVAVVYFFAHRPMLGVD